MSRTFPDLGSCFKRLKATLKAIRSQDGAQRDVEMELLVSVTELAIHGIEIDGSPGPLLISLSLMKETNRASWNPEQKSCSTVLLPRVSADTEEFLEMNNACGCARPESFAMLASNRERLTQTEVNELERPVMVRTR